MCSTLPITPRAPMPALAPRCPVVVVADRSEAMAQHMNEVGYGIAILIAELWKDRRTRDIVELGVVSHGPAHCEREPAIIGTYSGPVLAARGHSALPDAVDLTLRLLSRRKRIYAEEGRGVFRPVLVLFGDAGNGDYPPPFKSSLDFLQASKRLHVVGIGTDARSMERLTYLTKRPAVRLDAARTNWVDLVARPDITPPIHPTPDAALPRLWVAPAA